MISHNFSLVNLDTDSISFRKEDASPFSKEEQELLLQELNSLFPDKIKWEHDGIFPKVVVLKAKNYILKDEKGKVKIKGSALKSSKTEKGLKDFMSEIIDCLLNNKQNEILGIYHKYIKEVYNVKDIMRWCKKITVTESVLNPERTNEQKVLDALKEKTIQMGDKYYMYFSSDQSLKLSENWDNDHDSLTLVEKLYKTLTIFENVINMDEYPKYHLKRNQDRLEDIING